MLAHRGAQLQTTRVQSGELREMHRRMVESSRHVLERLGALLERSRLQRPFE